jgi:hypothetical protein
MRDMADVLDLLSDTIAGIYAERAGGTAKEWRAIMSAGDKWYNAAQAVEAKLANRVGTRPAADPEPEPEDVAHLSLFDALATVFTTGTRPTPQPAANIQVTGTGTPAAIDVEGIRASLIGVLA